MNIDLAVLGAVIGAVSFVWKIIAGVKLELKQCYEREASQNQRIEDCLHRIEMLECKLDGYQNIYSLLSKNLQTGIEHARKRLFEEIERIESEINKIDQQLGEITKTVYQKLD